MKREKSLFYKLIKCGLCQSNYKSRMNRNKKCYVCSKASNYGTCEFRPVEEEFIKNLIERRFQRKMSDEEIREVTKQIVITDKWDIEVYFNEIDDPVLIKGTFMKY